MIESEDNLKLTIDRKVAKMSVTLTNLMEDVTSPDEPIPTMVKSHVLKKIFEYCEHYANVPVPEKIPEQTWKTDDIVEWDKNFIQGMPLNVLFDLVVAANYLDIKNLLDLGCKTIAIIMKDRPMEDIKKIFLIPANKDEEKNISTLIK